MIAITNKSIPLFIFLILISLTCIHETTAQSPQNDANSGQDAPGATQEYVYGEFNNPIPIDLDTIYQATIGTSFQSYEGGTDIDDQFYIDAIGVEGRLSITLTSSGSISPVPSIQLYYLTSNDHIGGITDTQEKNPNSIIFSLPIIRNDPIGIEIIYGGESLDYQFQFTFNAETWSQNDGGFGTDVPGIESSNGSLWQDLEKIPMINLQQTYTGHAGSGYVTSNGAMDREDYYKLSLSETGFLGVSVTVTAQSFTGVYGGDNRFIVFAVGDEESYYWDFYGLLGFGSSQFFYPILEPGEFLIGGSYASHNVTYTFTTTFEPHVFTPQNDGSSGKDAIPWAEGPVHEFGSIEGAIGNKVYDINGYNDTTDGYYIPNIYNGTVDINVEFLDYYNSDAYLDIKILMDTCGGFSDPERPAVIEDRLAVNYTSTLNDTQKSFKTPVSECNNRFDSNYLLIIKSEHPYISYRITINFTPASNDTITESKESTELQLDMPNLAGFALGLFMGLVIFGTVIKGRIISTMGKEIYSKESLELLKEVFGESAFSYLMISENFSDEEVTGEKLPVTFPTELLKEKLLLHPIRLALFKLLEDGLSRNSSEIKHQLGVSWGELGNAAKALVEMGYLRISDQFSDGNRRQMMCLEPSGITKYHYLVDLLTEYLDTDGGGTE